MNPMLKSAVYGAAIFLSAAPQLHAQVQPGGGGNTGAPPCQGPADYSGTYSSDAQLIPAATGAPRIGWIAQCLTANCQFALNWNGGAATLTSTGSLVMSGQFAYFNAASLGFIPQGAVRIIASTASIITAFACPK